MRQICFNRWFSSLENDGIQRSNPGPQIVRTLASAVLRVCSGLALTHPAMSFPETNRRISKLEKFYVAKEDITDELNITREQMIELLNEDLAREYQAIISYVVYSQATKGAEDTDIAG